MRRYLTEFIKKDLTRKFILVVTDLIFGPEKVGGLTLAKLVKHDSPRMMVSLKTIKHRRV